MINTPREEIEQVAEKNKDATKRLLDALEKIPESNGKKCWVQQVFDEPIPEVIPIQLLKKQL